MDNNDLSPKNIRQLVDRYFDCSLSDEEERRLRLIIAGTDISDPAIDEMRALMGFRRPSPHAALKIRRFNRRKVLAISGVAAAIAVILTVGLMPFSSRTSVDSRCIAYSNGQRITDEQEVLMLIADDFKEFEEGARAETSDFSDELSDIAPIIENYESDFTFSDL